LKGERKKEIIFLFAVFMNLLIYIQIDYNAAINVLALGMQDNKGFCPLHT